MTTTETKGGPVGDDQTTPTGDTLVADIMERDVVTIGPDATVHELVMLLQEKDLGGVPVVDDDGRLAGIVTEGDLVIEDADVRMPHYFGLFGNLVYLGGQKKFEERLKKMVGNAVSDVMTTHVFMVTPDEPASSAANIMVDHKVNRVPVVDGGKLVGIVARHDIIKLLGL
jgi:CBS domain-containing protein